MRTSFAVRILNDTSPLHARQNPRRLGWGFCAELRHFSAVRAILMYGLVTFWTKVA